jgi:FeS assembly SUF system regulator
VIRLTKLADYGIVLLSHFARTPDDLHSARSLAEATPVPLPTVSKLLKKLLNASLLESHRGKSGGYKLARASEQISMANIVEALDGPVHLTECGEGSCSIERGCSVRHHWQTLNGVIHQALENLRLSELAMPAQPLVHLKARTSLRVEKEVS